MIGPLSRARGLVSLAVTLCVLTACGASDDSDPPEHDPPVNEEEEARRYSFPEFSEEDGYCDVAVAMAAVEEDIRGASGEQALEQLEGSLFFMSSAYQKLAHEAGEPAVAQDWESAHEAYAAAGDFYAATGGQVANTDFIAYLAEAVAASNEALTRHGEDVERDCGVDLSALVASGAPG